MSISFEQLLAKIEQEVQQAKQSHPAQMRERLHSIRTLCDLALDQSTPSASVSASYQPPAQVTHQPMQQTLSVPSEKPLQQEDGANGDSLFDF
ncbi:YwdI family protein [Jeotgalibacillus soli]|uniref:Uncharacterized protein n=1 Tax=Jeotgalibacillus soli TaxID=889306 RepID=A0A0C2RHM6_9BACL|nr:YwdI family protein [Jeotgalibacillus soli]KIL49680.1 hypothetical protein KP78_11480 [Jeotgalibacillus soli]